jgi:hypothetical protein
VAESWFPDLADGETLLDRVVNHRPEYAQAMRDVEAALREQDAVEHDVLDLCRQRVEFLLGAGTWSPPTLLSSRQECCVGFAEQLVIDAQGITDEHAARVIAEIGEGGFLVLAYACGFFETTARARLLLAEGDA